jgi:uracil-DNA glycosylase family 4
MLNSIDNEIAKCTLCKNLVEHFPNSKTISIGKNNDILILGEAPANNGWRKSGKAWYDINNKLLPSGVVMQKLLDELNIKLEDTYFLEAIKCYPKERKNLNICSKNCKIFLFKQIKEINPKIVLSLGDSATKTILDIKYKNFKDIVGKEYNADGVIVIPIYHPSPISPMSYKGNIPIFKKIKEKI